MNGPFPLRIAHVITTLDPGGAEHHLLELCRGLPRERFSHRVLVLKGEATLAPAFEAAGVAVDRVPLLGAADPTAAWRIAWRLAAWSPDVVHTHLFKAEVHGTLGAWLAGVPVRIATKHNEDQYLRSAGPRFIGRGIARLQNRVVAISQAVSGFAVGTGRLPAEKMRVIPYGIDAARAIPSRKEAQARLRAACGATEETHVFAAVGRLAAQKGHSDLLDALSRISPPPPVMAALIGAGPLEGELKSKAKSLGIEDRVRFLGFCPEAPELIAGADALVLPSRWEGFGMVLLEAMRVGVPIVATRVGAIPEVVADGETGRLVPAGDPPALAAAIREVVDDPRKGAAWGEAGRRRLRLHFTREKMCEAWAETYQEVVDRTAPSPPRQEPEKRCPRTTSAGLLSS
ncbi:MAG: glycosyltransferase [Planctomycetes bacterium]|nr:glycosyltransferase [Planctomycetota bacterium]